MVFEVFNVKSRGVMTQDCLEMLVIDEQNRVCRHLRCSRW